MSLTGAMYIGQSGLAAAQIGLQIAGNNIANASTPGYSRQVGILSPIRGDSSLPGMNVGRGVLMKDIRRQVDDALQQRLWGASSDESAAQAYQSILSQVESALGELGSNDLSSEMAAFFRTWSERANQTQANGTVVQQGQKLADFLHRLRSDLLGQRQSLDAGLGAQVERANQLIQSIADLNGAIADAEVTGGTASSLRDQRDQAITDLSQLMDVHVVEQSRQGVDVLVGSIPVVSAGTPHPIELRRTVVNGQVSAKVVISRDSQELDISSGQIGAALSGRTDVIDSVLTTLDTVAGQLAFEVNKLHATGTNLQGLTATTGTVPLTLTERTLALNDPDNQSIANLPYSAANGSFDVIVRERATGATHTVRVRVDLDGVDNTGQPGTSNDASADTIRAALDAVDGIAATFTPDGKLQVSADAGFDFSFANDSSGAVAVLGLNSFFTGTDAGSLQVRSDLLGDPSLLTTGRMVDGQFVENGTALQIAQLQDQNLAALGGRTISGMWQDAAQGVGVQVSGAKTAFSAATTVRQSLDTQRAAISGVSIDEESVNLLNFQRMYQASAKVISVADQMTQTLIQLV